MRRRWLCVRDVASSQGSNPGCGLRWTVLLLAVLLTSWGRAGGPQRGAFPVPEMTQQPADLEPFEYVEANVPYYRPGGGRKGDARWNRMQRPIAPEESRKHMVTPAGFEVKLFAAEPEIVNPICMNWDAEGRLWIAESVDYPNDKRPPGEGRDRIKICEDTDGDGRADEFTVFAEGLSIPTGLAFSRGGVIVHQAPRTLFLKDTDGDDRADVRQVLFEGWGTDDTHAGPSNLRYGLDNHYWGVVGYAGFKGEVGGVRHRFGQGFYRFRPDGSKLEFLRSTNNNTWGLGFSEEGLVFGSTANRNPSVFLPIPNRYYERVRGWSPSQLDGIADTHLFDPITDRVRQVDHHGGYTAGAGHALYTARAYPRKDWNRTAFVCGPTGHLVGTFVLERDGAGFASHNPFNLLASDDEWTAPTMAEVGPDGHVWVIDWYNYIVQHNPTPAGFETGQGNAYETPLRDKQHGRIYRVVYKDAEPAANLNLEEAGPEKLIETLAHDTMRWRLHAQRLLVERGRFDVQPQLLELVRDQSVDAIGLNAGAIHALWTLHGLGALDEAHPEATQAAVGALDHPSAGVRMNAVKVLPRNRESLGAILESNLLNDPDAQVRLAALLAISEMPQDKEAAEAVARELAQSETAGDPRLVDAATSAAAAHALPFVKSVLQREAADFPPRVRDAVAIVAEHYARGAPTQSVPSLIPVLANADAAAVAVVLDGLAAGWPEDASIEMTGELEKSLDRLWQKLPDESKARLASLSAAWGSRRLEEHVGELTDAFFAIVREDESSNEDRIAAARRLVELRPEETAVIRRLMGAVSPRFSPELASGILDAIAGSRADAAGQAIIDRLSALTPAARSAALRALLGREAWTRALLDGLKAGEVQAADLSLSQRRLLTTHPDEDLREQAKKIIQRGGGLPATDRQKVLEKLLPVVEQDGDAERGRKVFEEHCAKCHVHGALGERVGPDLTGMAAHTKRELLTQIIAPSRSVEGTYRTYAVLTTEGRVLNGMLAAETRTSLELIDPEAKRHVVLRENVAQLKASQKSLMPEGFEKELSREDFADLLAFLTRRERFLPLPLGKAATIVSTRGMFHSKDAQAERLIFEDWSPKTVEGVPFRLVDPRGGRVPNAVLLHGPRGTFPPRMPESVSLPCHAAAGAIHLLSGVSGWGYPIGEKGTVSMIVRLHYADGTTEDHPLMNGIHFADYIRRVDVPESKLAFLLRNQQLRYLAVRPEHPTKRIERIEFVKGGDQSAPIVMAATVELTSSGETTGSSGSD